MIGAKEIILLLLVVVLLFGRGKISELMGDVAKGIKSFKKGMAEDEDAETQASSPKTIEQTTSSTQASERDRSSSAQS